METYGQKSWKDQIPMKILLVEDDVQHAEMIQLIVSRMKQISVEQTWVSSLKEALDQLKDHHFDVILCDLGLPDSRGKDTFLKIQSIAQDAPIIVISASWSDTHEMQFQEVGANAFLVKGQVTHYELQSALLSAVGKS